MKKPFSGSYPVGAQLTTDGAAFRVWAPNHKTVDVSLEGAKHPLEEEENGYWSASIFEIKEGALYSFLLDGQGRYSDPASRFQPQGPHGPSQVINPDRFSWTDGNWPGISGHGQVVYEMHVGTFTREGTWQAAICELKELVNLGVTVLEIMPVADFAGSFGWGYDGVNLFAPTRNYGVPDDFRAFVDAAHAEGLAVILDVVYNHVGPDGNFLSLFAGDYFTQKYKTDWGEAINFDGENSKAVREFYTANAAYWIKEFHLDGLRLDATQNIYDSSNNHILTDVVRAARAAAGDRSIFIVGENEPQDVQLIRCDGCGGYGLDALWNDDFHHSAMVAATGSREAYYSDYLGSPQELVSATKYGFLYQGQWYAWQKQRRGTSAIFAKPASFVSFLQNHDQVANSARGQRLDQLTTFGRLKALTTLCLLGPSTPMLFQGQEFASSAPFLFFADHKPELAELVRKGRADFLDQWRSLSERKLRYDDPSARETFEKCKLDFSERRMHGEIYALHRDLIQLRKSEPLFARQTRDLDGEVLGPEAFALRFFCEGYSNDRLMIVNLGPELRLNSCPAPLLAPADGAKNWIVQWSTEDVRYGGNGTPPLDQMDSYWIVPAHSAVVLKPGYATPGRQRNDIWPMN
jgi:maltooligosyltrehalose trehalohydrolase